MATISTLQVDPPEHGPFKAEWAQPFLPGDDALDWYVTTGGVTRKVQRDPWIEPDVYSCQVELEGGTSSFELKDGPITAAPAAGWITPNLTGLKLRWNGQDTSIAHADFTDNAVEELWRDGHVERTLLRWLHSKITTVGASGTTPLNTKILGHHVFLHYRSDLHDVVQVEVLISNASARVANQGGGVWTSSDQSTPEPTTTLFGTIGFEAAVLELPAGWAQLTQRPLATGGGHCFPTKAGTMRRWVIYKVATPGAAQAAQDLIEKKGLARAHGGRDYLTVRSYGPSKSMLPDLAQGFTYQGIPGYQGAKQKGTDRYNDLFSRLQSGISGNDLGSTRFGLFHMAGGAFAGATGGEDIEAFSGLEQVREWVRYCELYASCKVDGTAVFLFNRDTGKPLRTSDFGDAYTNASFSHPGYFSGSQYLGRQPFPMYCQNDSGYDFRSNRVQYFTGWANPRWPPHTKDVRTGFPSGALNTNKKYIPINSALWGTPPSSLLSFTCDYRPMLEQVAQVHSLDGAGLPYYKPLYAYFASSPNSNQDDYTWKDPEDSQHAVRMFAKLVPCVWLGVDCLSKLVLDMYAEWFALEYSEVGHVPVTSGEHDGSYGQPGQPANATEDVPNNFALTRRLERQLIAPHTARIGCGRSEGHVAALFAIQHAIASPERRNIGYPAKGIRRRCEMMYDFINAGVLPYGGTYKMSLGEALNNGQIQNAFGYANGVFNPGAIGVPLSPPPIGTQFSIMQVNLELPLVHWGSHCLGKQLGRIDHHEGVRAAYDNYVKPVERYTYYLSDPSIFGPYKYFAVWANGTLSPVPGTTAQLFYAGSGTPGWPNCVLLLEMMYRISGDPDVFRVANYLGRQVSPATPPATRAIDYMQGSLAQQFAPGMVALLQRQPGPDIQVEAPDPPEIVSIVPTSGLVGSLVRIIGSGFDAPGWTAELGRTTLENLVRVGDNVIAGRVPAALTPGIGDVVVRTSVGVATLPMAYEVLAPDPGAPAPTFISIDPASGTVGTYVLIKGSGFNATTWAASIGGVALAKATRLSDSEIQGLVPALSNGFHDVEIVTSGGTATGTGAFEVVGVVSAPPVIISYSPNGGPVGTVLTILGTGFAEAGLQVTVGGVKLVDLDVNGDTKIEGAIPKLKPGVYDLTISTNAGSTTKPGAFAVEPPPKPKPGPTPTTSMGDLSMSFRLSLNVVLSLAPLVHEEPPIDPPVDPPPEGEPPPPPELGVPVTPGVDLSQGFPAIGDQTGDNVLLTWSLAGGEFRIVDGDLQRESGLAAAVLISLFSDARTEPDRSRSITEQDLRGWWGEISPDRFGSHLWLLERAKATQETLRRAQDYARASLQWMVEERIAREVKVSASFLNRTTLVLEVVILRGDARRWARLWKGALNVQIKAGDMVLQLTGG